MSLILPDLPYAYDALEPYIDEETMRLHHDKHHNAYVTNANAALAKHPDLGDDLEKLLANPSQLPDDIRQALINNGGGHLNHSLFWEVMTPNGSDMPAELKTAIESAFGSVDAFKDAFATAAKTRFGSGWAWLVLDESKNLKVISTGNQDSPIMTGLTPILGLDVWEHAYYLKYHNVRPDYINAFFEVINWEKVNDLYTNAK